MSATNLLWSTENTVTFLIMKDKLWVIRITSFLTLSVFVTHINKSVIRGQELENSAGILDGGGTAGQIPLKKPASFMHRSSELGRGNVIDANSV